MMQLQPSEPKQKSEVLAKKLKDFSLDFEAIGTQWKIEIFNTVVSQAVVEKRILKRIEAFDKDYSRFRSDSLITKMSQHAASYELPADARPMLDLYRQLYVLTEGFVTPLIGQTLSDAGYDAHYSFIPKVLIRTPTWDECIEYNFPVLNIKIPVLLDFGAAGKGYLVDIICDILHLMGAHDFIVNAGGDIMSSLPAKVLVALENPNDITQAVGIATLGRQAICGSSGSRRTWAGFTHIMNPYEPSQADSYKAVWVTAASAMLADALTTALYFCSPTILHKHFSFEYAIINNNNTVTYSAGFPAVFFNKEDE